MKKLFVFSIILKLFLTSILFADTTYLSGDVSGVWEASGSPYLVTGEIHVPTDSSLRIMPGCSVIFQGRYKLSIDNNAVFKAIGNAVDSIIFTPADTIITDSTGGHGGIEFNYAAEGCSLVYCKIEYGVTPVGGAIFCEWSNIYIINCTIINNTAWVLGGGLYFMTYNSVIIGNLVMNNKTCWLDGGGLYLYGGYPSPEPIFVRNQVTLVNNIIIFNKSAGCGGGVFCGGGDLSIINNTIINNSADSLGGGLFSWDYNSSIFNSIIWNNIALLGNEIYRRSPTPYYHAILNISNTLVSRESLDCISGDTLSSFNWHDGNIYSDPILDSSFFHLTERSPCVDAGAESIYLATWDTVFFAPAEDIEGDPRPQGDGWDIGADESPYSFIPENEPNLPEKLAINTYPNPFNGTISIEIGYVKTLHATSQQRVVRGSASTSLGGYSANPLRGDGLDGSGFAVNIFDINGRLVFNDRQDACPYMDDGKGDHCTLSPASCSLSFSWTPEALIPSGIYFIRVNVGTQNICKKIVPLK